ncbi:DMT family transporter [Parathalassolituus penaei]|uniref:DMT family transporter n=1 Tax=Parathalassolituus penaei TaxID=2997323 RepID=A0A9X3EGW5_9GAMM|nr:DMT family transporter [Parathalassolituus penaei]MCY0966490.1 DMT family transporter [Parathalassolituus penaei]
MIMLTALVLLAFAANSLLCRWALGVWHFDPALFTLVRLWSGALMLSLLLILTRQPVSIPWGQIRFWMLGASLLLYAGCFSWAYLELHAGVGAFVLFACVQLLLQTVAVIRHGLPSWLKIIGIVMSLMGLAWLLLPGASAPEPLAVVSMLVAGAGWAGFVVLGQGSAAPLLDVRSAFVAASVLVSPALLLVGDWTTDNWQPWCLALASGALASGLGYFGWYRILPALGIQRAAQLQLLVPVITVMAGVMILAEPVGVSRFLAMLLIVTGVYLSLQTAQRSA